ncbi:hypothetical protein IJG76_00470 [Candidatus Saccharibacteria bacterium]|nr:hypothetical protein [Candidatus Saccharibacteria bacterium]
MKKSLKGATSIYVVVFVSLILSIAAVSFITLIVSEIGTTMNNELAQSAYDASLAGVEDAKLVIVECADAYANHNSTDPEYTKCFGGNGEVGVYHNTNCNAIQSFLGRATSSGSNSEVPIQETNVSGSNTSSHYDQAYTCVTMVNIVADYRATLGSALPQIVVPLSTPNEIRAVKVSWYSSNNHTDNYNYYSKYPNSNHFSTKALDPPLLSFQLVQAPETFSLSDFSFVSDSGTNHGTLFLTPNEVSSTDPTKVPASALVKSNDKSASNTPTLVNCNLSQDYACSAIVVLPGTFSGAPRKNDNTLLILSLPYEQPTTDLSLELCTDENCTATTPFENFQFAIDSTGRANDVYSRVETRVEIRDVNFPFPEYAAELSGDSSGTALDKNFIVAY